MSFDEKTLYPKHLVHNLVSEGRRVLDSAKNLAMGSTLTYVPFVLLIERPRMTPYHKKLLGAAANKITITITIINLGYVWEELVLANPSKWEGSLLT